jgi:uncharacterized cupin superfamily protein
MRRNSATLNARRMQPSTDLPQIARHQIQRETSVIKSATFCWTLLAMAMTAAWAADAPPKPVPLKPVKVTAAQAAGPVFNRKDAVKENGPDGPTTDVAMMKSADQKMTAGLYKAGPSDVPIDSYPEDEFCYFLTGSVKLTSSDGTVIEVKAGEAVAIPKGWKGRWTTPGYTKYYVVYDAGATAK